jgi:hypothetical protein
MVGFSFQEEATNTENDSTIIHLSQQQQEMGQLSARSFLRPRIYIHLNANSHDIYRADTTAISLQQNATNPAKYLNNQPPVTAATQDRAHFMIVKGRVS